jgi:hypothetical protein
LNNDQLSSSFFFLLGLSICLYSLSYQLGTLAAPESGMMPFLVGAAICLLAGIGLVDATRRKRQGEKWSPVLKGVVWKRTLLTAAGLGGFLYLLKPLGFFLCTALFIGYLFRVIVPHRWMVVIGGALLTAAASYLVFELWLKAQLPKGPLGI